MPQKIEKNRHIQMNSALSWANRNTWTADRVKIMILYVFMLAGGLWHVLDVLQEAMRIMASMTMAAVTLWILYEVWRHQKDKKLFYTMLYWTGIVFIISLFVENVGVRTGKIFGEYVYGETLRPFIGNVPLAIGFAWINMLLGSAAVSEMILKNRRLKSRGNLIFLVLIALLMVVFDAVMEPAAGILGYWNWVGDRIPFQNYMAWFILALGFAALGSAMNAFRTGLPGIIRHSYFAQLGYFFIVNLK